MARHLSLVENRVGTEHRVDAEHRARSATRLSNTGEGNDQLTNGIPYSGPIIGGITRYREVEPRRYRPAAIARYRQTPVRTNSIISTIFEMVPLTGLEPVTPALRTKPLARTSNVLDWEILEPRTL